jgi:replicative DNA helicase
MARKQYSLTTELRVIRTLTLNPDSRAAQELLAKVDESFFASEVSRAAFRVCMKSLKKSSELPEWDDIITDHAIDESIRDVLEECDLPALNTKKRTFKALERLNEYRQLRLLGKIGRRAQRVLESTEPVNMDDEFAELTNILGQQKSQKNFKVLRIGKNSNSRKHVEKLLKGTAITYLPTGFAGFDKINRGIPAGSFFLIGAPTGAGKSTLISVLGENFAMAGAKVGLAPLEMSNAENLQRNVARVTSIDMTKLLDPLNKLNKKEVVDIRERWDAFDTKMEKINGQLEFYEFDEDITIEGLTATVKPFGLDVLIIDYLGLLDGTTGDDQWRQLGNAARYCHVWGKANNCIVVAAAQLSDDGVIRYAKAMQEHAKYFWYWTVNETNKATGIYEIIQRKARQASDHSFYLHFDLAKMTVKDADISQVDEMKKVRKDSKSPRDAKKVSKKWEEESSVGWGDEDDEEIPDPVPGKRAYNDNKKNHRQGKRTTPNREVSL